jgi:thiol:disulfide interchange protein DsbD
VKPLSQTILFLILSALALAASAADDFLPPEQAFKYTTSVDGDRIVVRWDITPGYYLYRKRLGFESATPDVTLGAPEFPRGIEHTDEYFGAQEIYREQVTIPVPFSATSARPAQAALKLKWQGCADAGLCYPPSTWKAAVALAPIAATATGLLGLTRKADEFLPPDEAFQFSGAINGPNTLHLRWVIADGYYLYKSKIQLRSESTLVQFGAPELPQGEAKTDEYFGTQEVYHQQVEADVPFSRARPDAGQLQARVTYQGCAEAGLCYPPITKALELELPAVDAATFTESATFGAPAPAEQDRLAAVVRSGSIAGLLGIFFVAGLALTFTPCVLPMVPILSGIIAGQGERVTAARGFTLSLTYVIAMALTYTIAGVLAGLFGKNLQVALQNPWVLGTFALLFVALAFSMFGFYELQMPASVQERLARVSNRQQGGAFIGVGVMGVLSALIVGPCVTAPLVAALIVIGQTGDPVRGGLALFALAMGMGVPLLLIGTSLGKLVPRAGGWMEAVKQFFGVLLLGVALWFAQTLLPEVLVMLLWGALAIALALLLGALEPAANGPAKVRRTLALPFMVWGLAIIAGAAMGNRDPLAPLAGFASAGGSAGASVETLPFSPVQSVEDLDRELAAASAAGKPAMLDFSADWCVSCKEMEKYTFPDAGVKAALAQTVLLRADVTENNERDQALLKRFGIFGPPTIAFFGADGVERKEFRLVGYVEADKFREHVERATAAAP